jgi:hypothetical protein
MFIAVTAWLPACKYINIITSNYVSAISLLLLLGVWLYLLLVGYYLHFSNWTSYRCWKSSSIRMITVKRKCCCSGFMFYILIEVYKIAEQDHICINCFNSYIL